MRSRNDEETVAASRRAFILSESSVVDRRCKLTRKGFDQHKEERQFRRVTSAVAVQNFDGSKREKLKLTETVEEV